MTNGHTDRRTDGQMHACTLIHVNIEGFADNEFRLAISCFRRNHRNAALPAIMKYREKRKKDTQFSQLLLGISPPFSDMLCISWISIERNKEEWIEILFSETFQH